MMTAGIAIVTWNSASVIGPCLDAALGRCPRLVVVDNASQDRTVEEVLRRPSVRLIRNSSNRGFAGASNQAVAELDCDAVLLLNPDAFLLDGIEDLLEALSVPGTGAAAGVLVSPDGKPQRGFTFRRFPSAWDLSLEVLGINRLWPTNPLNRRYRCLDQDLTQSAFVDQPAGAFLMVRRSVWQQLGGMDEAFHPLWFEDVDFLKRMQRLGFRTRYVPSVRAAHLGGHSLTALPLGSRQPYWYASLLRYASKNFGFLPGKTVCLAVAAGAFLRMVAAMASGRGMTSALNYAKVIRLSGRCLVVGGCGERGLTGS